MAMRYVKWEDEILLEHLCDVDKRKHWEVMKRCQYIADNILPHRSADGIKARWFVLIGVTQYDPQFTPSVSLDDLVGQLSPRARTCIKVRLPTARRR